MGTTRTSPATSAHISQCAVGWPDRTAVGHPHVEHVIDTEVRVFEQMCSLGVYLKGVVVIKLFWVQ